jgi:acid phosphatase family membrane protein YuiD
MFKYRYILVVVLAWIIAQGLKYIIDSIKKHKMDNIDQLFLPGGMPSAHSATVIALLTEIALCDGIYSSIFGLALLFTAIVIYDAVMVRRSCGEIGATLVSIINNDGRKDVKTPFVARGHMPLEALAGSAIGLIIGIVVFLATK